MFFNKEMVKKQRKGFLYVLSLLSLRFDFDFEFSESFFLFFKLSNLGKTNDARFASSVISRCDYRVIHEVIVLWKRMSKYKVSILYFALHSCTYRAKNKTGCCIYRNTTKPRLCSSVIERYINRSTKQRQSRHLKFAKQYNSFRGIQVCRTIKQINNVDKYKSLQSFNDAKVGTRECTHRIETQRPTSPFHTNKTRTKSQFSRGIYSSKSLLLSFSSHGLTRFLHWWFCSLVNCSRPNRSPFQILQQIFHKKRNSRLTRGSSRSASHDFFLVGK